MTKSSRSWLFFGVSASLVAGSAVLVGMTNRPSPSNAKAETLGYAASTLEAKDILKTELLRRFNDLSVPEVGMSRMVRPENRSHRRVMSEANRPGLSRWKDIGAGEMQRQVVVDGEWVKSSDFKPTLKPENEQEEAVIQEFKKAQVDVAIYTLGQFELDKGEKPDPSHKAFTYDLGNSIRVKGPAYLGQDSSIAPPASALVDFGRLAWASKQTEYMAEGKDGWVYFAHRVDSTNSKCASCHGDRKLFMEGKVKTIKGIVQRNGDPIGLFVIAMRSPDSEQKTPSTAKPLH